MPDFQYLNKNESLFNSIAVLDKATMGIRDQQCLKRDEVGNCLLCFENGGARFVLVGTVLMDMEEHFPQKGRLIVYEVRDDKLQLRHNESVNGSVQAMAFVDGETERYLVVGVNDEVLLFRLTRKD